MYLIKLKPPHPLKKRQAVEQAQGQFFIQGGQK
jgi:hypothetical protein